MLFKGFTTALAAMALSVASFSAAPAKADNDAAKIIAGVAAVAIIGAAIANSRDDRRYVSRHYGRTYYNPHYGYQRKVYRKHYNYGHYHGHNHHKHNQHKRW